jgi:hypothetical protein
MSIRLINSRRIRGGRKARRAFQLAMSFRGGLIFGLCLMFCAVQALGQTPPGNNPKSDGCKFEAPYKLNLEDCFRIIFTHKPLHPLAPSSIVPGSGPAASAALEFQPNRNKWQIHSTTAAGVSFRKFWFVESKINFSRPAFSESARAVSDDFRISIYGRHQSLPRMDFYGLGPDSNKQDLAVFSRRDTTAGVSVLNPVNDWLAVEGSIESLWPHIRHVKDSSAPSIEQVYTEAEAPGLTRQPHFMRYSFFIKPHYPPEPLFSVDYNIGYSYYQDTHDGRFSFHRFDADIRHHFRFGRVNNDPYKTREGARLPHTRRSNLMLRAHVSSSFTGNDQEVPFYYQETLGGSDIHGDAGLRAFNDYRFRDRNLLLFQGEYQVEIKNGYGAMLFYDAGKVAPRFGDLGAARLRHSYGVGLTVSRGDRIYFRAYVGLGGGEGAHPFFGVPKL